ncbi:MAG: hypothetical protein HQL33_04015 [Alphaproteobacteria bacterium]|nr:hypothetical protein [Alphaproteobacteria bacterium]MBF0129137.1 hypothetical protein [Alphaproteobacteria bacterium]
MEQRERDDRGDIVVRVGAPPRPADRWAGAGEEPMIEDVIADPLFHLLLRRDRLTVADICAVVEEGRRSLRGRG